MQEINQEIEQYDKGQLSSGNNKEASQQLEQDRNVIATADDAILSKLYTSQRGYYEDPFLEYFTKDARGLTVSTSMSNRVQNPLAFASRGAGAKHRSVAPRLSLSSDGRPSPFASVPMIRSERSSRQQGQPIIRRGTYARVCCMDKAIAVFLSCSQTKETTKQQQGTTNVNDATVRIRQVVVLGAGKDTSYFRYKNNILTTQVEKGSRTKVRWYDVDFDSVITNKERVISCLLDDVIPFSTDRKDQSQHLGQDHNYYTVGFDLRRPPLELFKVLVDMYDLNLNEPILFVLECVQMYMTEGVSRNILRQIAKSCRYPVVALYDPILQSDSFGKVMTENLTRAGVLPRPHDDDNKNNGFPCDGDDKMLSTLLVTQTLQQQLTKMKECGFSSVVGCNMTDAYNTVLSQAQRSHANRCEMLDELEEWYLLMNHYCLVVACGDDCGNKSAEESQHQKQNRIDWIDLRSRFLRIQEKQEIPTIFPNSQRKVEVEKSEIRMGFLRGKCVAEGTL